MQPIPQAAPAVEAFAPVPGASLWYSDTGGPGEAIVLCHPASQSGRIWGYQQPVFAAAGFRVIAYSRRGVGLSQRGSDAEPGTAVGDLAALLDHLGVATTHVLGAAAGGITAVGFAVAHPARVATLLLVGTIVGPDEDAWRTMYARLGIAAVRRHVPTEFLELGPAYRALSPDGVARFVALEHEAKAAGPPAAQPLGVRVDWAAMGKIAAPTLFVTGEADLFAPPPLQDLNARHIGGAETVTLPGIGHAPYWEAPDALNALILEFLARQRRRDRA